MNIGLITCAKLPNLTPADQLLIPELAKHNINAQSVIWTDNTINWDDFDYLIFRLGYKFPMLVYRGNLKDSSKSTFRNLTDPLMLHILLC